MPDENCTPVNVSPETTTTSCCCTETSCTPLDWLQQSRSILVSDYNNCSRQLNNLPYSLPFQASAGCIQWADGSAEYPISLRSIQTRTGYMKYLPALDDNKTLFALTPNKENGMQVLKYDPNLDAILFVAEPVDTCATGPCGSAEGDSGVCYDPSDISTLSSSEFSQGVMVLTSSVVDGQPKLCPRLVSESTVLSSCKDITTFPSISDTDNVYNAIWKARNTGIPGCECLELNYQEVPEFAYRKKILEDHTCVPMDLTTPAVSTATASVQLFDFPTLGVVQPDWANRVIVRISITSGSENFDDTSDLYCAALVSDGGNDLVSARIGVTDGTDSAFSGEVSLPISGTGFQLLAGSGIVTDGGVLSGNASAIFSSQVCIVGFESAEV